MEFSLQIVLILACLFYGARKGGVALGLLGGIGVVVLVFGFKLPPGQTAGRRDAHHRRGCGSVGNVAGVGRARRAAAAGGEGPAAQPEVRFDPRAVHDLHTDDAVRNRARGLHDAADHLRRRDQKRYPPRTADGSLVDREPDGHHGQPGIRGGGVAGGVSGQSAGGRQGHRFCHAAVDHDSLDAGRCADDRHLQLVPRQGPRQGRAISRSSSPTPKASKFVYGESATLLDKKLVTQQWTAMWIFVGAIAVVALLGAVESMRPLVGGKPLSMVLTIQMFMLMAGAFIIIFTKTNPAAIAKNEVFRAGMIAVVAVFGVAWMADTVFEANLPQIKAALADVVKTQPWTYALALLVVSKLVNSQAAAISAHGAGGAFDRRAAGLRGRLRRSVPMATTSCRPTRATWRPSSSTVRAPPTSAST